MLNVSHTFRYSADRGGTLAVSTETVVVIRSIKESRDEGDPTQVYWRTTRRRSSQRYESVKPGEQLRIAFTLNVSRIGTRIQRIREEIGGSVGTAEVVVRRTVRMRGIINGRQVYRSKVYTMRVTPGRTTYRVSNPGPQTERHQATRTITVRNEYGPLRSILAPLVAGLSFVALVGTLLARLDGRLSLSGSERELLEYRDDRSDFDEWIQPVRLPAEELDRPRADVDTLGDLVDIAISLNQPVIEAPDRTRYFVRGDGLLYTYQPPQPPGESPLEAAGQSPSVPQTTTEESSDGDGSGGHVATTPSMEGDELDNRTGRASNDSADSEEGSVGSEPISPGDGRDGDDARE